MSNSKKSELNAIIDEQKLKINKYEARIIDMVRAYKSLTKEKEALQATLSALAQPSGTSKKDETTDSSLKEDSTKPEQSVDEDEKVESLTRNISTLTASLHTLSEEKNKLEMATISERKKILNERHEVEKRLQGETESWAVQKKEYEMKIQELSDKVKSYQEGNFFLNDKDSSMSDTKLCSSERLPDTSLRTQRNTSIQLAETKSKKECYDILNQLEQEQRRAEAAEQNFKVLSQIHEERVAALESSISEMSQTAAGWERNSRKYLETVQLLKEEINELSGIKNANRKGEESSLDSSHVEIFDLDKNSSADKFFNFWCSLKNSNSAFETLTKFAETLSSDEIIHSKCNERFRNYEETIGKLERIPANNTKYGSEAKSASSSEDVKKLQERIRALQTAAQMTQKAHDEQISDLKEEISKLRENWNTKLRKQELEHQSSIAKFHQEVSEHQQRSLVTLQDREEEIHRLSSEIYDLTQKSNPQESRSEAAILLSQVNAGVCKGPLLHHLEELARKESEVHRLRREATQLDKNVRDIQMTMIQKQESMQDVIDELTEELERMKRNKSRESENLEYIKNVVFQYLVCSEYDSRLMILKAIAAVLKFTPDEEKRARTAASLWWWQNPSQPNNGSQRRLRLSSIQL